MFPSPCHAITILSSLTVRRLSYSFSLGIPMWILWRCCYIMYFHYNGTNRHYTGIVVFWIFFPHVYLYKKIENPKGDQHDNSYIYVAVISSKCIIKTNHTWHNLSGKRFSVPKPLRIFTASIKHWSVSNDPSGNGSRPGPWSLLVNSTLFHWLCWQCIEWALFLFF